MINKLNENQRGATLVEYVLLTSLVALGAIVTVSEFGFKVGDKFVVIKNAMECRGELMADPGETFPSKCCSLTVSNNYFCIDL